ncbi:hypothetical protein H4R18_004873 [Coemansia javaensis]|uniref:Iron export ABC transporter permease subunit FetB n=1 Tax=Coemansia javaensis TaxID=2761396 RepID=A0A9W8H9I6_9FUNG|nr:hypothetical protein H4R18_004873 [Coemansia javaensis]
MADSHPDDSDSPLTWWSVGLAASLLAINVAVSSALRLRLEKQIVVAGARCFVQLTVLGLVLKRVFSTESPAVVFTVTGVLGGLAALEVSEWRAQRRVRGMFWIALVSIVGSATAIGLVGAAFSMRFEPIYKASKFIPVLGMLYGNTMVGVSLGINAVLEAADVRRSEIEGRLCYGASRWEAVRPTAVDAARTAMVPSITMVGITGLIAIPGMMSGQILGGASATEAARYQQIITFMIAASVALGVVGSVLTTSLIVVDGRPQLRPERILGGKGQAAAEPRTPRTPASQRSVLGPKPWRDGGGGARLAAGAVAGAQ